MGKKMSATALRLGINKTWSSLWYADKKEYQKNLHQDLKIRDYIRKKLNAAGLDKVEILRSLNNVLVNVFVARPGVAIGRGGEGIDQIKKELSRLLQMPVEIKINEVKKAQLSARVIARNIADGIEKRQVPKKLMTKEKDAAMQAGALGVRIMVGGRIGGAEIARTISMKEGPVPLQTLRANIDFAEEVAQTANAGLMGVKVWVYRKPEEETEEKK